MRQGPHAKRGRNRGGNRRPGAPNRNHTFDSNGPDVRIRGNASQVYEKYLALARDATANGDRILAESYYQHGEHYYRIMSSFNEENERARAQEQPQQQQAQQHAQQQPAGPTNGHAAADAPAAIAPAADETTVAETEAEAASQPDQPSEDAPRERPAPRRRRGPAPAEAAPTADAPPTEDDIPALRPRTRRRTSASSRGQTPAESTPVAVDAAGPDPAAAD